MVVSVTAKGIGINASDHDKLFDRFYRVESEIMGTVSGFGIGLYLVAEILRLHNTKTLLNSAEGMGSTFSFSLPIHA
ncbi:ATP-binding protein [Pedobacter sp. MC2016-14]|uniref:ATP-binding protein n=1 Tax=Pedobacter sp. MC2016-14 TaxID=2897327 RepID=UPI00351CDA73